MAQLLPLPATQDSSILMEHCIVTIPEKPIQVTHNKRMQSDPAKLGR